MNRTRKTSLAFFAFCAIPLAAFSQSTWNDLRFGSSLAEVRQSLSKQGFRLEQSDKTWIAKPQWELRIPGTSAVFHFVPYLTFSSDKLERVELEFKDEKPAIHQLAVTTIEEQLIGKYGAPATQKGACNNADIGDFAANEPLDCKAAWKAKGQSVSLDWYFHGDAQLGTLTLRITYRILQSRGL